VLVRVIAFGSSPGWTGQTTSPVPIESFTWDELEAEPGGLTELGAAVELVRQSLAELSAGAIVPPALLLVSDGMPTDVIEPDFEQAMTRLEAVAAGRAATRMAIGIGRDVDMATLRRFIGRGGGEPVRADTPQQLMVQLRERIGAVVRSATEVT
jgi:uncharacterized protein YegL